MYCTWLKSILLLFTLKVLNDELAIHGTSNIQLIMLKVCAQNIKLNFQNIQQFSKQLWSQAVNPYRFRAIQLQMYICEQPCGTFLLLISIDSLHFLSLRSYCMLKYIFFLLAPSPLIWSEASVRVLVQLSTTFHALIVFLFVLNRSVKIALLVFIFLFHWVVFVCKDQHEKKITYLALFLVFTTILQVTFLELFLICICRK